MCVWEGKEGRGLFIVLEGIDGAGKTTQAHLLVERLKRIGRDAVYLKEPTNGPWGQKIRRIAVQGRDHVTPDEELEYFLRDREEDSKQNIIPALNAGRAVVMDRYIHSNAAYQGALGFDPGEIFEKNRSFPKPDIVFFLDISPEDGLKRVDGRGGANAGFEKIDYLHKVYGVFNGRAKGFENMVRIDARRKAGEMGEAIWQKLLPFLERS